MTGNTKQTKVRGKSKSGGGARKIGTKAAKPAQKKYVSTQRSEYNRVRRAARHAKRVAKFIARASARRLAALAHATGAPASVLAHHVVVLD